MMCACEREFARRFLSHQLSEGAELETRRRVPVTIGFQEGICNACRGLPEEPHPRAEIYGQSSKIVRYYWREIFFEAMQRFGDWANSQGFTDYTIAQQENPDTYAQINKEVTEEIKELHKRSPKYRYREKSQQEVLEENNVEVVRLEGAYVRRAEREVGILDEGKVYSAEEFAALHYKRQGYEVLFTESIPFHVIFGIYMWLLIQDPKDPRVRIVGFDDRTAFKEKRESEPIWTHLPEDFGAPGYASRRITAIEDHFAMVFANGREDLFWLFDYWLEPSEPLRQYLWAHRAEDVDKARKIVSLLSADDLHRILRYLVADYWRRYVGWPDLIVYRQNHFFFAEVKSSKDKLRENQKNWIYGNSDELHFSFKLVKIHRKAG
jgi:Holliday junction resolvase-like predicted endonuclease